MKAAGTSNAAAECYLILGGNGFVGSHIVDALTEQGKTVRVLDPFRREPQFLKTENVTIIKGSAFDPIDLSDALKGVTHVIYSLSATNPFTADTDPYADIENLRRGVEILENCVRAGVSKFGFISSGGSVYGRLAEKKSAEETDAPLPVSPYGICKLTTEHYLEYFKRKYGLEYTVYRLSNPYGPRQAFKKEQGVIPVFLKHILNNSQITIFGDGTASRDYIYMEDAARMIVDSFIINTKHNIYNIGSGQQITLNNILSALESILNKKGNVEYAKAPPTTLNKTGISIERYTTEFGVPKITPFDEGLKHAIKQFSASDAMSMLPSLA